MGQFPGVFFLIPENTDLGQVGSIYTGTLEPLTSQTIFQLLTPL